MMEISQQIEEAIDELSADMYKGIVEVAKINNEPNFDLINRCAAITSHIASVLRSEFPNESLPTLLSSQFLAGIMLATKSPKLAGMVAETIPMVDSEVFIALDKVIIPAVIKTQERLEDEH